MDRYLILPAYPWEKNKYREVTIESQSLLYTELGDTHAGSQVTNQSNKELIHNKLKQVADLIREIDTLNQPESQISNL